MKDSNFLRSRGCRGNEPIAGAPRGRCWPPCWPGADVGRVPSGRHAGLSSTGTTPSTSPKTLAQSRHAARTSCTSGGSPTTISTSRSPTRPMPSWRCRPPARPSRPAAAADALRPARLPRGEPGPAPAQRPAGLLLLRLLVRNPWAALGGALLFGIHPVQVETVAWISELRGLLGGFFACWPSGCTSCPPSAAGSEDARVRRGCYGGWRWRAASCWPCCPSPARWSTPLIALLLDCGFAAPRPCAPILCGLAGWAIVAARSSL